MGVCRIFPNFFQYTLLSQEWVTLYTKFKFGRYIQHSQAPYEQKAIKNFGKKGASAYLDTPTSKFFEYPLLFQERVKPGKANNCKFCTHILISQYRSEQKAITNFDKCSRGRNQGLSKNFRASMYWAHHAVLFAIAQLSCFYRAMHQCIARY